MSAEIDSLFKQAANFASSAVRARQAQDGPTADRHFQDAFEFLLEALSRTGDSPAHPDRVKIMLAAVQLEFECGEVVEAQRLLNEAFAANQALACSEEWETLRDIAARPDPWLIAAVGCDPPDAQALDVLIDRHWQSLFGRCQILTRNHRLAGGLARDALLRLLRTRHTLKPRKNFPTFLATIATNLWSDSIRSARRSVPLADDRVASLNSELPGDDEGTVVLADMLPDLKTLQAAEQAQLKVDLDRALDQLTPVARKVLVARYQIGESCAKIGNRFDRTERPSAPGCAIPSAK